MAVEDLAGVDLVAPLEADLCIIGSGPAAYVIAEELRESKLRILIVESGGIEPEPSSDALNTCIYIGTPLSMNQRARVLGGTSAVWTGRCVAFDDIDYEARSWAPFSGWPIGGEIVKPYLDRAAELLRIAPYEERAARDAERGFHNRVSKPGLDPRLREAHWTSSLPPPHFGAALLTRQNWNLRIIIHATVTHLNTDASLRHIESVEISDAARRRGIVRARAFVLAAGGIENARILLYSNRVAPNGVGNQHDVVGRYFMDHPRDLNLIARIDNRHAAQFRRIFGPHRRNTPRGRCLFDHGFKLSPAYQRSEGLLNAAAWPFEVVADDDPFFAMKRLVAGPRAQPLHDGWQVASQLPLFVAGAVSHAAGRRVKRKVDRIGFLVASEQTPDPDSRIRLSERRDWLGLPITAIDWRIGPKERASQAALARIIAMEFRRLRLPPIRLADWVEHGRYEEAEFVDGCHPIGATRMASDPRYGVVDADCQVHGVDGLFIAGSSVFPTGSHANPTLMIAALALRLSHHLRDRLAERVSPPARAELPYASGAAAASNQCDPIRSPANFSGLFRRLRPARFRHPSRP